MRPQDSEFPAPKPRAPRVLLAEDDREFRALIALALGRHGFEVIEVDNGSALVERLSEAVTPDGVLRGFDLVLSDVRMPGFSAIDVLSGMQPFLRTTPVVLITAFGDPRTRERARRLGAAAVIDKPFDLDDLGRVLVDLLAAHAKSRY